MSFKFYTAPLTFLRPLNLTTLSLENCTPYSILTAIGTGEFDIEKRTPLTDSQISLI